MASERIDDIVSQQAIEQLIALGQQLQAVKEQMNDLIVDVAKFSAELNNIGSVREMSTAVNNLNTATNNLNTANRTRLDIEREIKREGADMAKQVRDEATYYANLDAVMEQHVKTEKALKDAMDKNYKAIESNKIELKNLEQRYKGQLITEEEYIAKKAKLTKAMQENKSQLAEERRQLKWVEKDLKAASGSYDSLNAQLGQLREVWRGLSEEERENADVGGVLQAEINRLDEILKGLDKSIGNNQRNVGNYEIASKSAVKELKFLREEFANLSEEEQNNADVGGVLQARMAALEEEIADSEAMTQKFASTFNTLIRGTFGKAGVIMNKLNSITGATAMTFGKTAVAAVKAFGRQLLKLLANPIIAIISGIALAIMAVVKAFKQNEELMNRLKAVGAGLMPIVRGVGKAFEFVAKGLMTAVEWMTKWLPLNEEAIRQEKMRQAIEKREQGQSYFNAQRQAEIEKLLNKLENVNLTYEEREKIYGDIRMQEKAMETENLTILDRKIKLKEKENKQDAESIKELQELKTSYQEALNSAEASARTFREEKKARAEAHNQEIRQNAEKARQRAEEAKKESERLKKQLEDEKRALAERKKAYQTSIEDLTIQLIKDAKEQENALHQLTLARIEEAKNDAIETATSLDEINLIIKESNLKAEAEEQRHQKMLADIDKTTKDEEYKKMLEKYNLDFELQASQLDAEGANYKTRLALQKAFWNEAERINKEAYDKGLISEEQYTINSNRLAAERIAAAKAEKTAKLQASQSIIGSIADIMLAGAEQIEDEKKRVKIEQAITMAKVLLTESLAIAQAVLTNTEVPEPYTLIPRIVASVATITGTFITAIAAITKAQNAYAEGTDYHRGGSAIVGEGAKNGHWQSEIVETPDGKRFLVDKPTYFSNMPVGTKVIPTEQYGSSVDLGATNSILERIANKGQVIVNVDDKITNYILTKNSRIRVLNSKFKYN